jgi:hypothetical protein
MWPIGSNVKIQIAGHPKAFSALARVIYNRPMLGMGVAFTQIDPDDQSVLDSWIAELSKTMKKPSRS